MVTFPAIVILIPAILIAVATTRRTARYGAGGMTAGMAAMMAAMGTGLSVGYATGMVWDLGWANLIGVLAGFLHGLWMGRRYGPMAALDGAGGGVMGGLMGPMLAVMLLYLPLSLGLTAFLMLALQAAFSAGAVYLVATAAGAVPTSGWLHLLGRVLGAGTTRLDAGQDHYEILGVPPDASSTAIAEAFLTVSRRAAKHPERAAAAREALAVLSDPLRRAKYDVVRLEAVSCCPTEPATNSAATHRARSSGRPISGGKARLPLRLGHQAKVITTGVITGLVLLLVVGAALLSFWSQLVPRSESLPVQAAAASVPSSGGSATTTLAESRGDVQQVAMTLRYPRYEPNVVEVKSGVPVRLTLQAIGGL